MRSITASGHEAARALARLLRAATEYGDELALRRSLAADGERREVTVPEALRGYRVESASARDYDRLLPGGAL